MKKRIASLFLFALMAVVAMAGKHYTVIVSLDGCRWDYPTIYNMPNLQLIGQEGVTADMQPSFPSSTFPNHYTLATGLVPDHHGIIDNKFLDKASGRTFSLGDPKTKSDPYFWGGEPIWITAKKQGVKTGVVYWPGSDVAIKGSHPDYWFNYEKKPLLTYSERVAEVERLMKLSESDRPTLVMVYFDEPDHTGHTFGPTSTETKAMAATMDQIVGQLYKDLKSLPNGADINLIIVADHGMTRCSKERIINIADYLKPEWYTRIAYGIPTNVSSKKGCEDKILKALAKVPHIRAWKKGEMPAHLHYGTNPNIGDIVVLQDLGWVISDRNKTLMGHHGYDPTYQDMHVIFRAAGPDFKKGYTLNKPFVNTAIYPLLAKLMGITPAACDGNLNDIMPMLAQ